MQRDLREIVREHLDDVAQRFDRRKIGRGRSERPLYTHAVAKAHLSVEEHLGKKQTIYMAVITYTKITERDKDTLVVFYDNHDNKCRLGIIPYNPRQDQENHGYGDVCVWNFTSQDIVDWLMPVGEIGTSQFRKAHNDLLNKTNTLTL